jgi:hypothetical protein
MRDDLLLDWAIKMQEYYFELGISLKEDQAIVINKKCTDCLKIIQINRAERRLDCKKSADMCLTRI